ncbi:MAG TPA: C40 family peptidase [Azospira sp.]|nr:C40 family peptidase [Azospira sp.]HNN07298.1 C40 family peptidase [Azospira sp.]HNN45609.1 C40 family peptidase [Azospira sp.]
MQRRSLLSLLTATAAASLLAACGSTPVAPPERSATERGREVAIYAMSLIDTGYRFGGKNPEAGLDCSGMVAYIFEQAAGLRVSGSAADIAKLGRPVDRRRLLPGDLVFFNTLNRPLSHVGIYIGDGRFVHAPSSASGRVRIDSLGHSYFAPRYETARSYFD